MKTDPWNAPITGELSNYSEIEPDLQTFDIVLWCGGGNLSRFIQLGTQSPWSHVGLVIRVDSLVLLYESTLGEGHSGVRSSLLKGNIGGRCAVRRLQGLDKLQRGHAEEMLEKTMQELDGRPFESNIREFLWAGYDGPFGANQTDLTSIFCAELVAEVLQRSNILQKYQSSNEFTPGDFAEAAQDPVRLETGLAYGPEIFLQPDPRYSAQMFGREAVGTSSKILDLLRLKRSDNATRTDGDHLQPESTD